VISFRACLTYFIVAVMYRRAVEGPPRSRRVASAARVLSRVSIARSACRSRWASWASSRGNRRRPLEPGFAVALEPANLLWCFRPACSSAPWWGFLPGLGPPADDRDAIAPSPSNMNPRGRHQSCLPVFTTAPSNGRLDHFDPDERARRVGHRWWTLPGRLPDGEERAAAGPALGIASDPPRSSPARVGRGWA